MKNDITIVEAIDRLEKLIKAAEAGGFTVTAGLFLSVAKIILKNLKKNNVGRVKPDMTKAEQARKTREKYKELELKKRNDT